MSILDEIEIGESKTLELKVKMPKGDSIVKTIISFSNISGGKLIIGVSDDREIVGLGEENDIFDLQDQIASLIYDSCYPNILPEIYTTNILGKVILIIEVSRGNLLPYYLKRLGKYEGTFIRVGATNRKASIDNIAELERYRRNSSFDLEVNKEIHVETLDLSQLEERFKTVGKSLDMNVMKNLKLVQEERGIIYPTNGLLVLIGNFDHVNVKCSRFKGNDMDVFLDRKEFKGDIFDQLERAYQFIYSHLSLSSEIKTLIRQDILEIPEEAIREGLVNAFVHRDYANNGRDIKVGIYDDSVKIISPGAFPSTISQADILDGRSEIRNKVVARIFKELNYIEQWGSGIRRIISSCEASGLRKPQIIEKGDSVELVLFRKSMPTQNGNVKLKDVNQQEKLILDFITTNNGMITTHDVVGLLNVKLRRSRDILKAMVNKGVLERIGSTSNSFYQEKK